jgi:hypothetical protein
MQAELIKNVPLAGECDEVVFGDAAGNCLWVRFWDSRWREWCGVFQAGDGRESSVHPTADTLCFVLAGGFGYWVDVESRRVLYRTGSAWIERAISVPGRAQVAATDDTNIYLITPEGVVWDSGRVAYAYIGFDSATTEEVKGSVNGIEMEEYYDFTLRLDGPRFECPWEFPREWDTWHPERT